MTEEDAFWRALSDPTRREILDRLRDRSMTTGELCSHFPMTRFAVMKHLKTLVEANLVAIERRGRKRYNHLNPVPLQQVYHRWIKPFEAVAAERLIRLKATAESSTRRTT